MNARAKPHTRFVAALVTAILFAAAAGVPRTPSEQAAVVVTNEAPVAKASPVATTRDDASAVVLPQIVVRPTSAERAAAMHDSSLAVASPFVRPGDATASAGGSVSSSPRMNFEMPYYAFGKVPARSSGPK